MAIISSTRPPGTGGGGQTLAWAQDEFAQTAAWSAGGLTLTPSETIADDNSLFVWSQGQILHPDDYTITAGAVVINFGADPATDTSTGTWYFVLKYQYTT